MTGKAATLIARRPHRPRKVEWAAQCALLSFGVKIGVRLNRAELLAACKALFPPGWKATPYRDVDRLYSLVAEDCGGAADGKTSYRLYVDGRLAAISDGLDQFLDVFEAKLHQYVAAASPQRLFVHAGVVGWRGKAIVLPGRSFAGKTTLVAELVKAGATYYSDEYAVLDAEGRVYPFPRPLAVRDRSFRQLRVGAAELGARVGRKPLPVGAVVAVRFKAGATWQVRQLSAGQGLLALMRETVAVRRQPQRTLDVLRTVVAAAPVFHGVRGKGGLLHSRRT